VAAIVLFDGYREGLFVVASAWLESAVSAFGSECKRKLAGPGGREAAIRTPLETLLKAVGDHLGVSAQFHDEVRDASRRVRPDYGVAVGGAITGYVEVKAPGKPIDPATFAGHDREQWQRQKDLPNLLYTNGTQWRLFRDGQPLGAPVWFTGGTLESAGAALAAPAEFERLVADFLRWKPSPITSVGALVRAVAPLTRLLRGEVVDQLDAERRALAQGAEPDDQPFTGLAADWRMLLFPEATDAEFADGYAQAVAFALLLARTEGIDLAGASLHSVGQTLSDSHTLMGRALQLLTDDVTADFKVTLDLMVRVIGAVEWSRIHKGDRDAYLHLYEDFLEHYDNDLRKRSGTYYTPSEVVEQMVRLTEEALVSRLGKAAGFADEEVVTVDPAMGTGTFLLGVLERVASRAAESDGPGAVPGVLAATAGRLNGFEIQMGPFAVAELRIADFLSRSGANGPGARLYVTNTLDDPYIADTQLTRGLLPIARSRRKANEIKKKALVTVVIGNPPYKELAVGEGGWVESGSQAGGPGSRPILEDFFDPAANRFKAKLKNRYVYFWRWATWKVWESTAALPGGDAGVVCFISTAGYLTGPGFTGMRRYLREQASEGWIIDLTPEGQTPGVSTRIFPGVRQPLAIGLFVRRPGKDTGRPAAIRYRSVGGSRDAKFRALGQVSLDDAAWRLARDGWTEPFTAGPEAGWDNHPALADLLPWYSPGVFPTRRWVVAPSPAILRQRWVKVVCESDPTLKAKLFKEGRDANLLTGRAPLPGKDTHQATTAPFGKETSLDVAPVPMGYRAFDRQWIIPDPRVIDMPRRDLWEARATPGQVFAVEQHSHAINSGPGVVFSALIPDFDHFNNRGGRVFPFRHPDGAPNLAPGLLAALGAALGVPIQADDVIAYIAAVTAHPAYAEAFAGELATPGIRVPLTSDPALWGEAVGIGREVLWLHTFGGAFDGPGRPKGSVRLPPADPRRPRYTKSIGAMPEAMAYDPATQTLRLGDGEFAPVPPEVWAYAVGGKNVLASWFNYRKANPGGKKTSPLDFLHVDAWDPSWSHELIDLLTALTRLVALEPSQAELLRQVLAGPLLASVSLAASGVRWPVARADRKPRRGLGAGATAGDTLL
jgi:hypothetical protein